MTDNSPQQPDPLVPAGLRRKGFWLALLTLRRLVADGRLVTRVGENGETLFQLPPGTPHNNQGVS